MLKKEIELLKNNSSNKKIDESSDYKKEEAKGGGSSGGAVDKTVYYGFYFSVNIPPNFTISKSGGNEVYLISQDETVEFFAFSPLWSGNPETYLKMAPTEELEYEKTTEVKEGERPNQYGDDITPMGYLQSLKMAHTFVLLCQSSGKSGEVILTMYLALNTRTKHHMRNTKRPILPSKNH